MSETTTQTTYRPESLLTRQQAAAYLGVSVSRLAQLRREGRINHVKWPDTRAVRYRFDAVEKLRCEREVTE